MPKKPPLKLADAPDVMKPWEVARVLQVGLNQVYYLLDQRRIPGIKLGKRWRVPKSKLVQFLEGGGQDGLVQRV